MNTVATKRFFFFFFFKYKLNKGEGIGTRYIIRSTSSLANLIKSVSVKMFKILQQYITHFTFIYFLYFPFNNLVYRIKSLILKSTILYWTMDLLMRSNRIQSSWIYENYFIVQYCFSPLLKLVDHYKLDWILNYNGIELKWIGSFYWNRQFELVSTFLKFYYILFSS